MKRIKHRSVWIVLFLASGLLAGCAMPELFHMRDGSYAGFTSLYSFGIFEASEIQSAKLLPYLISVRLPVLLFLWMSSFTTAGLLFHLIYGWWLLASASMLLSLFLLRSGVQGLLLFGCCLLPQWVLYALCWKKELTFLRGRLALRSSGIFPAVAVIYRQDLLTLGQLSALCLAGCVCEAFSGTWTLQIFLRSL